jgi:hypothetical protein
VDFLQGYKIGGYFLIGLFLKAHYNFFNEVAIKWGHFWATFYSSIFILLFHQITSFKTWFVEGTCSFQKWFNGDVLDSNLALM